MIKDDEFEDEDEAEDPASEPQWRWTPGSPEQALRWDCLLLALVYSSPLDKAVPQAMKFEKYLLGTVTEVK